MNSPLPLSRNRRGFTLIELLVVIAIIGLLAAFLFPAVKGAMRAAQTSRTKSNIRQVVAGMLQFKDNNDYFFPGSGKLKSASSISNALAGGAKGDGDKALDPDRALFTFIRDAEVFESPSDRGCISAGGLPAVASAFEKFGTSFLYCGADKAGLLGMNTSQASNTDRGRKYTDPYISASSLKILFYEPPFVSPAGKAEPQAQWHDAVVGTVAGFLDGHADFVKKVDEQLHVTGKGDSETELKRLAESKRPYY